MSAFLKCCAVKAGSFNLERLPADRLIRMLRRSNKRRPPLKPEHVVEAEGGLAVHQAVVAEQAAGLAPKGIIRLRP